MRPARLLIALVCLTVVACSRGVTEEEVREILGEYSVAAAPEPRPRHDSDVVMWYPSPTPRVPPGTKAELFPVGMAGRVDLGEFLSWDITVLDASPDATDVLLGAPGSSVNAPPLDGYNYLLIRLKMTFQGSTDYTFDELNNFRVVPLEGGRVYSADKDFCGTGSVPEPLRTDMVLAEGASVEGNICFNVLSADADTLVLIVETDTSYGRDWWWYALR